MCFERVFAYIDGFNLYYGMLDARLHNARWLDVRAMCAELPRPYQRLSLVRYFTARVRGDPEAGEGSGGVPRRSPGSGRH